MDFFSRFYLVRLINRKLRVKETREPTGLSNSSFFPHLAVPSIVADLVDRGFNDEIFLSEVHVMNILNDCESQYCDGDGQATWPFRYHEKSESEEKYGKVFSSAVYKGVLNHFASIRALSEDPTLLTIAKQYIGNTASFMDCRLWWTFTAPAEDYDTELTASFFHYDKDDYACLRLFFYLTDVDDTAGPHHVILTSHRKKTLAQMFSLGERSQEHLLAHYGEKNHVVVCGSRGQGFLEDPFCFHRASRPLLRDRLVLQLRYATKDYGVFNDN